MEDKSSVPKFDCYKEPATLGPRWTRWLTAFELYADGKGLIMDARVNENTKIRRRALLLHHAGTDVQDIFSTLDDTGDASDYDQAVKALNDYFVPKVNNAFARQTFYQLSQNAGETIQQFVTRLRRTAKDCAFGGDLSNQLRDAVLSKCSSEYVKRKLLEEGSMLNLDRALEIAAQCERVEEQMAAMRVSSADIKGAEAVNHVSKGKGERGKFRKREGEEKGKTCFRCGHGDHFAKDQKCPARGQTCRKCNGKDHYAKMCKSKGSRGSVKYVDENEGKQEKDFAFVVRDNSNADSLKFNVGGIDLVMLIDSGATTNIVDENTWEMLKENKIKCKSAKSDKKLYEYSSKQPLPVNGVFTCEVKMARD